MFLESLIDSPPSLRLLCVCRIRQSISCMEETVEHSLVEKLTDGDFEELTADDLEELTAGDLEELRNPNIPVKLTDMCKY